MNNIQILGVSHKIASNESFSHLMDEYCDSIFKEKYFPMLSEDTLIIFETKEDFPYVLTCDNSRYEHYLKEISELLFSSDHAPDILPCDVRMKNRKVAEQYMEKLQQATDYLISVYDYIPKCNKSTASLIDELIAGKDLGISPTLCFFSKQTAKWMLQKESEQQKKLLSLATQYSKKYEHIFVIVGGLHAIKMKRENSLLNVEILFDKENEFFRTALHASVARDEIITKSSQI